jgi:predicted nucleotidyltransferase
MQIGFIEIGKIEPGVKKEELESVVPREEGHQPMSAKKQRNKP